MEKKSPDAFRTISEVSEWLETPTHVLRFWESKFTQVKPVKRAGGRRYYRPADMLLLGGIKKLLHEDGLTIRGAQKMLREQGVKRISALSQPLDSGPVIEAPMAQDVEVIQPSDNVVELSTKPARRKTEKSANKPAPKAKKPAKKPKPQRAKATPALRSILTTPQARARLQAQPAKKLAPILSRLTALQTRMKNKA